MWAAPDPHSGEAREGDLKLELARDRTPVQEQTIPLDHERPCRLSGTNSEHNGEALVHRLTTTAPMFEG
jgi:hypothetical protein